MIIKMFGRLIKNHKRLYSTSNRSNEDLYSVSFFATLMVFVYGAYDRKGTYIKSWTL